MLKWTASPASRTDVDSAWSGHVQPPPAIRSSARRLCRFRTQSARNRSSAGTIAREWRKTSSSTTARKRPRWPIDTALKGPLPPALRLRRCRPESRRSSSWNTVQSRWCSGERNNVSASLCNRRCRRRSGPGVGGPVRGRAFRHRSGFTFPGRQQGGGRGRGLGRPRGEGRLLCRRCQTARNRRAGVERRRLRNRRGGGPHLQRPRGVRPP